MAFIDNNNADGGNDFGIDVIQVNGAAPAGGSAPELDASSARTALLAMGLGGLALFDTRRPTRRS